MLGPQGQFVGVSRAIFFVKVSEMQVCAIIRSAIINQSNMHEFSRALARKSAKALSEGAVSHLEKAGGKAAG